MRNGSSPVISCSVTGSMRLSQQNKSMKTEEESDQFGPLDVLFNHDIGSGPSPDSWVCQ